jgi:hypothetical protein
VVHDLSWACVSPYAKFLNGIGREGRAGQAQRANEHDSLIDKTYFCGGPGQTFLLFFLGHLAMAEIADFGLQNRQQHERFLVHVPDPSHSGSGERDMHGSR